MKLYAAALLAAFVAADNDQRGVKRWESQRETDVMCEDEGSGVTLGEECVSMWFNICEEYAIEPEASCKIRVGSTSELKYFSDQIEVQYWMYTWVPKGMSIQDFENSLGGEGDAQPENRQKVDDEALAIAYVDQTSGIIADYVTKSLIDLLNALGPETIAKMDPETLNSYLMEKGEQASEDATAAAIANYGTYSSGYTPGLAGGT